MNAHDELRDAVAKAIADHIGHGMAEKCYGHADAAIAALAAPKEAEDAEANIEYLQRVRREDGAGAALDDAIDMLRRLAAPSKEAGVDIDAAVNRFLGWKLPKDFYPDAGISFAPTYWQQGENADLHWPVGTNLLTAVQAKAMFTHCLAAPQADQQGVEWDRENLGRIVRDEWTDWAREQPNPKESWLLPWPLLTEPEREVDRRIGERIARCVYATFRKPSDQQGAECLVSHPRVPGVRAIKSAHLPSYLDAGWVTAKPSDQQGASLEGLSPERMAHWLDCAQRCDTVIRDRYSSADYALVDAANMLREAARALASKASPDDQRQEGEYTDPDDVFLSQGTDDVPCLQVPGRILVRFTPGSFGRAYELFSGNTPTASAAREGSE